MSDGAAEETLLGLALAGQREDLAALECFRRAIALQPDYLPALVNHAMTLRRLNRLPDALAAYEDALRKLPQSVELRNNLVTTLLAAARYEAALLQIEQAIALQPTRFELQLNRAAALSGLDRHEEALAAFSRAVELQPRDPRGHAGRAGALLHLERFAEAVADCDVALSLAPDLAEAHFNRATALRELLRLEEAMEAMRRACTLRPQDAAAQFALGCLTLLRGEFYPGWQLYEWRGRLREPPPMRRFGRAHWNGRESLTDKRLFVYADQGLGDTIFFFRYVALAQSRGASVVLSVQDGLRRLLLAADPGLSILGEQQTPASFDYQIPLASLPHAFGTTQASIPASPRYLRPEPARVEAWRHRLGEAGFKIGVAWEGSANRRGAGRSFPLQALAPLATLPGVRLISLQKGVELAPPAPQAVRIETLGVAYDAGDDAFVDAAAVMECLDLIITCDTAIAHLAGALGRPTWVALKRVPDWRWLLDRQDTPWYPRHRLYRQTQAGVWTDVFEHMGRDLRELRR